MPIKHAFTSTKADGGDATLVKPSDWNTDHLGTNAHGHADADTGGTLGINALSDVDTATTPPTEGQALLYDATGALWKPGTVSGGGGGGGFADYSETNTEVTTTATVGVATTLHTKTLVGLAAGTYEVWAQVYQQAAAAGHIRLYAGGTQLTAIGSHNFAGYKTLSGKFTHAGGDVTILVDHYSEGTSIKYGITTDTRFGRKVLVTSVGGGRGGGGAVVERKLDAVYTDSAVVSPTPTADTLVPDLAALTITVAAGEKVVLHYNTRIVKGADGDKIRVVPYRDGAAITGVEARYSQSVGEGSAQEVHAMWILESEAAGSHTYAIRYNAALGTSSTTFVEQQFSAEVVDEAASAGDTAWHLVGATGEPVFENGWVNYDTTLYPGAGFRKDSDGYVHLQGFVKSGTVGDLPNIFTLPVGYRPVKTLHLAAISSQDPVSLLRVYANGRVNPFSGSNIWYSLDGITFLAES